MAVDVDGLHAGPGMTGTPIAHGNFSNTGARRSGSSNISCAWAAASSRYECTITGENYFYTDYTAIVTPMSGPAVPQTASGSGDLIIYFHNLTGGLVAPSSGFAVAVFKQ